MNEQEMLNITREQEKEITSILIDSSLYPEMSEADRQKLLHYLVASYFNPLPGNNSRALPKAIQNGPEMSIETH